MSKSLYLTFFWLWLVFYVKGFGFECPYKECQCDDTDIECIDKRLTSVPQIVSNNTAGLTSLLFNSNKITVIPAESLPSNLTEIFFDDNPITTIDEMVLDKSSNTLEMLSFSNVRFTKIPDALHRLRVLKHLSIYSSNITDWNVDVMKSVGLTLENVYLNTAGIIIRPSWLQYFSNLTELTMDNCFVFDFADNTLDKVIDSLRTLSLFNNSLTEVPKAFSKLSVLKELNLGNNKISNTTWLPHSKLSTLTLYNNYISDANLLSRNLLPYADSLKFLDLHGNKLTAIPDLGFLSNVGELDFTYNRISDPYSGSLHAGLFELDFANNFLPAIPRVMSNLSRLSDVKLTYNAIKEIKGTDFPPNAVWIWLGYNLITEVTDKSFPQNSTIQYLELNNNPITKISDLAFKNLPRLAILSLKEIKITRLPLALTSVHNLMIFDATDNTHLICTCMEKGLRPLFVPMLPGNVLGDCGQTSIYNFYAFLSSGCPAQ